MQYLSLCLSHSNEVSSNLQQLNSTMEEIARATDERGPKDARKSFKWAVEKVTAATNAAWNAQARGSCDTEAALAYVCTAALEMMLLLESEHGEAGRSAIAAEVSKLKLLDSRKAAIDAGAAFKKVQEALDDALETVSKEHRKLVQKRELSAAAVVQSTSRERQRQRISAPTAPRSRSEICKLYTQGMCTYGRSCIYQHVGPGGCAPGVEDGPPISRQTGPHPPQGHPPPDVLPFRPQGRRT